MCGISILLDPTGSPRFVPRLLAMHAVIRHRGPDGEGFLVVDRGGSVIRSERPTNWLHRAAPHVGFAFRRLKICDLSEAADQPMGSADGKIWVVFNGEIYNFRELRTELEAQGHVFRTHGDTEVVLAAYEQWGEHCFDRLDGMWAIAILDLRRNRLVVSRDRFGIKPVYWKIAQDGAVLFASEIKQILAATDWRAATREPAADCGVLARLSLSDAGRDLLRGHPLGAAGDLVRNRSCRARRAALPVLLESRRLYRRAQQRSPTTRPLQRLRNGWRRRSFRTDRPT